jgi:hypothetical protein
MTTALGDLRARLDALTDRAALRDLVHGYVLGFDDRRADAEWMRQVFTEDVSVEFPVAPTPARGARRAAPRHPRSVGALRTGPDARASRAIPVGLAAHRAGRPR